MLEYFIEGRTKWKGNDARPDRRIKRRPLNPSIFYLLGGGLCITAFEPIPIKPAPSMLERR